MRPALIVGFEKPEHDAPRDSVFEPSHNATRRIGANVLASATVNTDFAETEVDTRRTNLTRFSLFFPEKRTFFLEGSDIFDCGVGLQDFHQVDLLPFHSRRIGLYEGEKVNDRLGNTNFGAVAVRTGEADELVPAASMRVVRLKQNVLEESSIGAIAAFGDPEGRSSSWMTGLTPCTRRPASQATRTSWWGRGRWLLIEPFEIADRVMILAGEYLLVILSRALATGYR